VDELGGQREGENETFRFKREGGAEELRKKKKSEDSNDRWGLNNSEVSKKEGGRANMMPLPTGLYAEKNLGV